ncbi:MAG: hypothetical protein H3C35_05990 [Bacteroidetes bacterium]|nr:hypothetical protein [Bacteroidota bacterium]
MKKLFLHVVLQVVAAVLFSAGCHENIEPSKPSSDGAVVSSNCIDCHTNYALLKQIASPDTSTSTGGCGGDAPHIETYDKVYLGGEGFELYKKSMHGTVGCVWCHGGDASAIEKKSAHAKNFIAHPSLQAEKKCIVCHSEQAQSPTSIHAQGWGQKNMVTVRYGAQSYTQIPEHLQKGYDVNCGKCHATCGDCHINRPKAGGGGLYKGHAFMKTPNMVDQCVACHVSRGGHAFLGIAPGTVPDIHRTKMNANCLTCHTGMEIHGDGMKYEQRYSVKALPKCESCHANIAKSNVYHTQHIKDLNCQTCHAQEYNNCGSCHVGGEGARVPSYQGFKIGVNPIPETRSYPFVTLRRSLMAPDSWKEYNVPVLTNFDAKPTYKYTTPHNILRWTKRTEVASGKSCYDNCHIIKEGTAFRNKELYLFNSDLESWEIQANKKIVVDGKLPSSWGVQ